ncbi:hypothetical protein J3458_002039 [Metarhizium acridum]|uniref:uncharacterized protein n=1 Tax=Metarhizium acridum TaxID=92637 RepID=UPI001C6B1A68|nr:hypothetical protein J3458_002039 [Metarhizium acridum]
MMAKGNLASFPSPPPTSHPAKKMPALDARQNAPTPTAAGAFIPAAYGDLDSSPSPGVVVGIVLGSVAGALLLLYLLYTGLGCGPASALTTTRDLSSSSVLSFRPRKRRRPPSRAHATETLEVHVREDGGGTDPRPPPPPPPRAAPPRPVAPVDEVVVIEEHELPRGSRRKSRRKTTRHSSRRRSDDRRRSRRYS